MLLGSGLWVPGGPGESSTWKRGGSQSSQLGEGCLLKAAGALVAKGGEPKSSPKQACKWNGIKSEQCAKGTGSKQRPLRASVREPGDYRGVDGCCEQPSERQTSS